MLEENTQCIASALRNAIINLDMIPKVVYQDNGRAFRAKYFTGDKGFIELGFQGLYSKLGIETVFARPYDARTKVIERFFKEFQEGFEKLLPSYIGSSINNKPAYMMRNEKLHKSWHNEYIPTIEETIKMIDMWLNFKNSQACPNAPNKTIAEVLSERKRQNIDINILDDLMLATEIKTIQRNGIRFLNCDYFDERLYGFKNKVLIKYNLFDLTCIKVYTPKGEYLCTAERVTETHPMAKILGDVKDFEDYKQKIVKQRQLKKKTINSVKQNIPKMGLVYGESGLGKSQTALWLACKYDAIYLRATNLMTGRWLLEVMVKELDEIPRFLTSDNFNLVVKKLKQDPKIIFIDEIDYLMNNYKSIETLRDIHDETNCPIIFIGMGLAHRKLERYKHLYDRFSEILKFETFGVNDLSQIVNQLSEVPFTPDSIEYIYPKYNRFRQIVQLINQMEHFSKDNNLTEINLEVIRQIL